MRMMTSTLALAAAACGAMASFAAAELPEPASPFTPAMAEAARLDPRAFTLDEETMLVEPAGRSAELGSGQDVKPQDPKPKPPAGGSKVDIEKIINTAEKIFAIISKNKPVVNIKTQYACAVPKGIDHWTQLEGWKPPVGTSYRLTAKNLYGIKVVDVKFQVLRTQGGRYKGKGLFLTGVSVEPLSVDVAWGYSVDLTAEVQDSTVVNVGTAEDPVAGMMPALTYRVRTMLKDSTGKSLFFVQGDGLFQEVGGPSKPGLGQKAARVSELVREVRFE